MKIEIEVIKGDPTPAHRAAIEAALKHMLSKRAPHSRGWSQPSLRGALPDRWRGWGQ